MRQQPPEDVSTPGHGQGEGPAIYEFLHSKNEVDFGRGRSGAKRNGVPLGAGCLSVLEHQDLMKIKFFRVGYNGFGGFVIRFCDVVHDVFHIELDFV